MKRHRSPATGHGPPHCPVALLNWQTGVPVGIGVGVNVFAGGVGVMNTLTAGAQRNFGGFSLTIRWPNWSRTPCEKSIFCGQTIL